MSIKRKYIRFSKRNFNANMKLSDVCVQLSWVPFIEHARRQCLLDIKQTVNIKPETT